MLKKKSILIVDDEPNIVKLITRILEDEDYDITSASNAEEADQLLDGSEFDAVISDLALPGMTGMELLNAIKQKKPGIPFIMITGHGTIETAVEAIKQGAFHYITKPFQKDELKIYLNKAFAQREMLDELNRLRDAVNLSATFENIVGKNRHILELFKLVRRISDSPATVLIEGESGTGKELFAQAIHRNSSRRDKPFVTIHCAGIPETLLESELFGHTQGAYTGAVKARKGLFEEANGGTIFLDEIGEFSQLTQTKLLRVIQEREIKPLGSNKTVNVDVRLIAATNKDLLAAVKAQEFREDLYYRIAVVVMKIPPLRERKDDIAPLCDYFVKFFSKLNNRDISGITPSALSALMEYSWPGNVRELKNVIENASLLALGPEINASDLPNELKAKTPVHFMLQKGEAPLPLKQLLASTIESVERESISNTLLFTNNNRDKAAKLLGISRRMLYYKIEKYKLD